MSTNENIRRQSFGGDGGDPHALSGIRVIAFGGRSGALLDQLDITYVENFVPSVLVERGRFIVHYTPPGIVMHSYTESTSQSKHSYEKITETMLSQQYNASVEAEYYAKVSASTEIKHVSSEKNDVKNELSRELKEIKSQDDTILEGQVGVMIVPGNIMKHPDGTCWMYKTGPAEYTKIGIGNHANFVNCYDLTRLLSTQMPGLIAMTTEKNGYTFYKA